MNSIEKYLKEFLNIFWLRPENALLLSLRANSVIKFHKMISEGNSIDVSCGDGFFSFITMGGKLGYETDMFQSINYSKGYRKGNFDSFDHFDEKYDVVIEKHPEFSFDYGSDWKENLIMKAKKLDFYNQLIVHDNNIPFPFDEESFSYIYTNSSYWVEKFEDHISDLIRMLKKDGLLVLEIKVDNILNFTSRKYLPLMSDKFHEIIDAGRLGTWKGLKSVDYLKTMFHNLSNEIVIEEFKPVYGGNIAKIWDIGLRPVFSPLAKMANNIDSNLRKLS